LADQPAQKHRKPQLAAANNVYELRNTGALVNYLHKAMFSPTKSALLQAVKNGHLVTWLGLTEKSISKHLKLTSAITMGHINQRRQNIRSTSKAPITSAIEDVTATPAALGTKTHLVYAILVDQGQLYTDLTGKFPVRSSKGNWYVMVCYVFLLQLRQSCPDEVKVRLWMGRSIWPHPSRTYFQGFQTQTSNPWQQSIRRFEKLSHYQWRGISAGSPPLASPKRRWESH
jgi:hypothetical protein